jgi:hypothetical protein
MDILYWRVSIRERRYPVMILHFLFRQMQFANKLVVETVFLRFERFHCNKVEDLMIINTAIQMILVSF